MDQSCILHNITAHYILHHSCNYDADSGTLLITYTTSAHEKIACYIAKLFVEHITSYPNLCENTHWEQSFRLEIPYDEDKPSSGVAEFTLHRALEPYLVVEVTFSQKGKDTENKCEKWINGRECVAGAVLVDIKEDGGYQGPTIGFSAPSQELFADALQMTTGLPYEGIFVAGHFWFKPNTCTVTVLFPKDDKIIKVPCVSSCSLILSISLIHSVGSRSTS